MKVGDRLGRFELTRELGRGSHGVVFEATDVLLGERVAIKALQPWLAGDVTLRERFKRELVLTRRVSHPGVARLHDLHEESGILFISMQYVEGKSLSQILRVGLPSEEKVIHILRGVCSALAAAHAEGVVHRDLKPANIMVTDQDKIIVLDFGIATATGVGQLTRPGEAMGSVPYVPPEVWEGGGATALGDQYALAVTGFVCLTRELPYNGKSPLEVLDAIRQTQATIRSRAPHVDPELEAVILKAMSKSIEGRYPSIADFDDALRAVAERRGMATKPPTGASSVPTPSSSKVPQAQPAPVVELELEPMPLTVEMAAPAQEPAQDAGAAAVAAALEEDAFDAAFNVALPDAPLVPAASAPVPSPTLGGAAAARSSSSSSSSAAAAASEGDFRESTAVEAVEGHEEMLPFATAIMDAPQGLTAHGAEPVSMASSAFIEAVADPNTTIQDGPAIVDQAAAAAAVDAVADAFEAGVAGKPSVNKTELVDRKRLNEVLNDVTMIAPMPTEPESSSSWAPPKKKSPLPLVAGGLVVAAVVLGFALTRGGDDVVPVNGIVDAGAVEPVVVDAGAVVEAVVDAGAAVVEPVADAGAEAVAVAAVDAGVVVVDAVVDAGVATPTGDLTLDDLDAPPQDPPPPPDPTGTAKPRLSSAGVDAVASAAAKKGIRAGDVPALDAAVAKGRKAARANDKAGLEAATKSARTALDATTIDKPFVSDKLARFNSAFDKVKDPALKAKVQPLAREVLKNISKGQWQDANKKLNESWAMIKKGR